MLSHGLPCITPETRSGSLQSLSSSSSFKAVVVECLRFVELVPSYYSLFSTACQVCSSRVSLKVFSCLRCCREAFSPYALTNAEQPRKKLIDGLGVLTYFSVKRLNVP